MFYTERILTDFVLLFNARKFSYRGNFRHHFLKTTYFCPKKFIAVKTILPKTIAAFAPALRSESVLYSPSWKIPPRRAALKDGSILLSISKSFRKKICFGSTRCVFFANDSAIRKPHLRAFTSPVQRAKAPFQR